MSIDINNSNVQVSNVTTVSNTANINTDSLFLQRIKGVSESPLNLGLSKSFHDKDYGAHDMAYSAYVREKREAPPPPDMSSNDIGAAIERMQPKETARCFDARALIQGVGDIFVSSAGFINEYVNVFNSEFCKFVYRNPPPPKTTPTTTMCNWWAISGTAQGSWSVCRPTTPTVESSTKV